MDKDLEAAAHTQKIMEENEEKDRRLDELEEVVSKIQSQEGPTPWTCPGAGAIESEEELKEKVLKLEKLVKAQVEDRGKYFGQGGGKKRASEH